MELKTFISKVLEDTGSQTVEFDICVSPGYGVVEVVEDSDCRIFFTVIKKPGLVNLTPDYEARSKS